MCMIPTIWAWFLELENIAAPHFLPCHLLLHAPHSAFNIAFPLNITTRPLS